jgi:hypothetical protein
MINLELFVGIIRKTFNRREKESFFNVFTGKEGYWKDVDEWGVGGWVKIGRGAD